MNNFIKFAFILICAVQFIGCDSGGGQPTTNADATKMPTTKPMPPLTTRSSHESETVTADLYWRLVDGRRQKIADFRGKVLVLDFWATYCPPCEEEIPHLVEISNNRRADGVQVVGLNVGGADDKPNIADFVTKYRMTYSLGYPEQGLMDFYLQGDDRIPQTLVFDRDGNLAQKFVGFTPEIKAQIDSEIQKAVIGNR